MGRLKPFFMGEIHLSMAQTELRQLLRPARLYSGSGSSSGGSSSGGSSSGTSTDSNGGVLGLDGTYYIKSALSGKYLDVYKAKG